MTQKRSEAQRAQVSALAALRDSQKRTECSSPAARSPKTRRQAHENTLRDEIQKNECIIQDLKHQLQEVSSCCEIATSQVIELTGRLQEVRSIALVHETKLGQTTMELQLPNESLLELSSEIKKLNKKSQRLAREKYIARKSYQHRIQAANFEGHRIFSNLTEFSRNATARAIKTASSKAILKKELANEREATTCLRKKVHSLDQQQRRAKDALHNERRRFRALSTWKSTKNGVYTMEARQLARALLRAGCAGERVGDAIKACAKAFRVRVTRVLSRHTVFRARDEGGEFALMQLGREISQSKGE